MNFIKKIFSWRKKNQIEQKNFPEKKEKIFTKIKNFYKKFSQYFVRFLIILAILCGIFIWNFLWDFRKFIVNIPELTGFFWEKNYLVLMLNNSELRPWWGFISSFAEVKFFFWFPNISIKNSYDIANPKILTEPPYPYNKLLAEDAENYFGRVFRDANLSPDFETNAKKAIELYQKWNELFWKNWEKLEPKKIDWVFSVDMNFLKSLLKISWPVEVNWKIFNENNFFYQTQILSKDFDLHSFEDLQNRKNFLKPLVKNIFHKILSQNILENWKKILNEIEKLAQEKHIQIYFADEDLKKKVQNLWWDWNFHPQTEDYVSVNIANIWWRKADRYIRKNYFYDVDFTKENAVWTLKITAEHFWTKSLISDFYQAYYRIFLPKWVKILSVNWPFKDKKRIYEELNSTVIWGLIHMQPGEKIEILIKYELPKIVKKENYNLHLITQAWWNWENWKVSVKSETDKIWRQKDISWKNSFEIRENLAFFEKKISSDAILHLQNLWDKTWPIIVWQKFVDKNLIEINFSEKISKNFLKNEKNFSFFPKNKPNQKIEIAKKYIKWNNLYLELKNFEYKKWEFYLLLIDWIRDLDWNWMSRNPVKITIVWK